VAGPGVRPFQSLEYGGGLMIASGCSSEPSLKLMDAMSTTSGSHKRSCSCPSRVRDERFDISAGSWMTWMGISSARVPCDEPPIFRFNTSTYRRPDSGLRNVGSRFLLAFTGTTKTEVHGGARGPVVIVPAGERRCKRQGSVSQ